MLENESLKYGLKFDANILKRTRLEWQKNWIEIVGSNTK